MSVREKLNDGRTGIIVGVALIVIAGLAIYFYMHSGTPSVNAKYLYFTDDDGASYYKDSVYNFPPYDHNGKTAYMAQILSDNGHYFVGYLIRYTPAALKQLKDKYQADLNNHMPDRQMQQEILDYLHGPMISWQREAKLPGPGHNWVPWSQINSLDVKTPSGGMPDGIVFP
jgi:hypothetical protein